MKKFFKQSLMIIMCIAMLSVGYAIGATGKIHTEYSRPNVYVDGTKIDYTYADGTKANAFMSTEWVTYMPVRAIAEALGKEVTTEGTNVYITSPKLEAPFTLGAGQYVVGVDIPAGKYDCKAVSGSGNFTGDVKSQKYGILNEILGAPGTYFEDRPTYSNLILADGDLIEINSNLRVEFTAK